MNYYRYIDAEECYRCGKEIEREEVLCISLFEDYDDIDAYCDDCYKKISSKYICNKITKFIYKRWFLINQIVEAFLDSFHKKSAEPQFNGELKDGKPHGYGVYRYDGYKYTGEFSVGLFNGHGVLNYPDGSKRDGYWKDGKPHGKNIYITEDGAEIAFDYGKDGNDYRYGTCHIWGIHKILWYLLIALVLFVFVYIINVSSTMDESIVLGLLIGLVLFFLIIFMIYVLFHVITFLILLVLRS